MLKLAGLVGALAILGACSETNGAATTLPTGSVAESAAGISDCTSGQDSHFLNENQNFGGYNPFAAICSGNCY